MYLLVATATPDLRSGFALLVDGTSSARHKVFGMALLGVFGLMITAAMELLSSVMICTCALGTLLCCPVSFSLCCWMQCVSSAVCATNKQRGSTVVVVAVVVSKVERTLFLPFRRFPRRGDPSAER